MLVGNSNHIRLQYTLYSSLTHWTSYLINVEKNLNMNDSLPSVQLKESQAYSHSLEGVQIEPGAVQRHNWITNSKYLKRASFNTTYLYYLETETCLAGCRICVHRVHQIPGGSRLNQVHCIIRQTRQARGPYTTKRRMKSMGQYMPLDQKHCSPRKSAFTDWNVVSKNASTSVRWEIVCLPIIIFRTFPNYARIL